MHLILYSKAGCHLCEGLQEKLLQIKDLDLKLEIRDITTRQDWFLAYQYEIPVLCIEQEDREQSLPRLSPRASVEKLAQLLQKYNNLNG